MWHANVAVTWSTSDQASARACGPVSAAPVPGEFNYDSRRAPVTARKYLFAQPATGSPALSGPFVSAGFAYTVACPAASARV
jgi:hypothetical protein